MGMLDGRCALITGAGSGLGRAGAMTFAREGAKVIVADVNAENGTSVVREICEAGGQAVFVRADVSRLDEVERMVQQAAGAYGRLDIFWHNAGNAGPGSIDETLEDSYDLTMSIHLKAGLFGAKSAVAEMKKLGGGVVLFTSSLAGLKASRGSPVYGVAKAGLIALTKNLTLSYGLHNIRVNAICPGPAETPMLPVVANRGEAPDAQKTAALVQTYIDKTPLRRLCTPQDVANAALFLCSDLAGCVTGEIMSIDGGLSVI